MANPYNNGMLTWNQNETNAARDFFNSNPTADALRTRANQIGLDQRQVNDLWGRTMGSAANPYATAMTAPAATTTTTPAATTTQAGATTPDLTQTIYNTPQGVTDSPAAPQVNWGNAYSNFDRNMQGFQRVAQAGNFVVGRDNNGAAQLFTVDQNGTVANNFANLTTTDQVARLIAQSGLYRDPNYRQNMAALAQQLDAAGVNYRPNQAYQGTGSNHGTDLVALSNGQLGAAYDWTSDPLAGLKGPTGVSSVRDNQIAAQILGIQNANSGLLGQNIASFNPAALGNETGGISYVNTPAGATRTQAQNGTFTDAELANYLRGSTNLMTTPVLPGTGRQAGADGISASQPSYYTGQPNPNSPSDVSAALAAQAAALAGNQPGGQFSSSSSSTVPADSYWNVTPEQTVEGRLQNLLDDRNPLVDMARTQGMQDAQARGLLNSSLGAQAGAAAAYQYAMPIAQADASTFASAARENAGTAAGFESQARQFAQADKTLASTQAHDMATQRLNNDSAMQRTMAQINATARQNANNISAQFRTQYNTAMNTLQSQYAQMYSNIQASQVPTEAKTSQLQALDTWMGNFTDYYGALYTRTEDMSQAFSALERAD